MKIVSFNLCQRQSFQTAHTWVKICRYACFCFFLVRYTQCSSNTYETPTLVTSSSSALQSCVDICGHIILSPLLSPREISNWHPNPAEATSSWARVPWHLSFEGCKRKSSTRHLDPTWAKVLFEILNSKNREEAIEHGRGQSACVNVRAITNLFYTCFMSCNHIGGKKSIRYSKYR